MSQNQEPLADTLERLRRERDEADARYNQALTALDQAPFTLGDVSPDPPAVHDDRQLSSLNESFQILTAPPISGGLKGRLAGFIWRIVGPTLQRQAGFNATLVEHLNRNVEAQRRAGEALARSAAALRLQRDELLGFRARLLLYLQQITLYIDTRDRETAGQSLIVNAAVNAAIDDGAKRWESMVAREQRFNAKVAALTGAVEDTRALASVAQQAALTVKRELERGSRPTSPAPTRTGTDSTETRADMTQTAFTPALDAYKYVGFEDQFRGSRDVIRKRLESYLPYFDDASNVLDVGCGRGEFLELLEARGISAHGLDLNHEMAEGCRARGLDVAETDVVSYLEGLPDGSLGGLFAAQVVEHLQPAYLLRFLELAHHKLRPGAPIVLETLNPACWVAFFESFIRDITHVWPLHPETLRYLTVASGFATARIEWRSPVPPQDALQRVAAGDAPEDLAETFNANVDKLNARMFTFMDYAIVGANA